jgi:hypothetical protein
MCHGVDTMDVQHCVAYAVFNEGQAGADMTDRSIPTMVRRWLDRAVHWFTVHRAESFAMWPRQRDW